MWEQIIANPIPLFVACLMSGLWIIFIVALLSQLLGKKDDDV